MPDLPERIFTLPNEWQWFEWIDGNDPQDGAVYYVPESRLREVEARLREVEREREKDRQEYEGREAHYLKQQGDVITARRAEMARLTAERDALVPLAQDWMVNDGLIPHSVTPEQILAARAVLLAALIGGEGARSRAEGSDLSVDQGREFRVVDGLGDNNRAGKVTIDPTLLSPATPRSRAEAEAMVAELFPSLSTGDGIYYITQERAMAPGIADGWPEVIPAPHTPHGRLVRRQFDRAALLAALTGEGT